MIHRAEEFAELLDGAAAFDHDEGGAFDLFGCEGFHDLWPASSSGLFETQCDHLVAFVGLGPNADGDNDAGFATPPIFAANDWPVREDFLIYDDTLCFNGTDTFCFNGTVHVRLRA